MEFKKGQQVRVTTRKGEVKTGTVVEVRAGMRGSFVQVKHSDGTKDGRYRPSAVSA